MWRGPHQDKSNSLSQIQQEWMPELGQSEAASECGDFCGTISISFRTGTSMVYRGPSSAGAGGAGAEEKEQSGMGGLWSSARLTDWDFEIVLQWLQVAV
jgi:hypothetical protein